MDHKQDVNQNLVPVVPVFTDALPMEHQVAGHSFNGTEYIGLLRHRDGYVLKPVKKERGKREIKFYQDLQTPIDATSAELKKFIPKYYGTTKITSSHDSTEEMEYLVLRDVARGYAEPCIMDIKIGKQTWDPTATEDKKRSEMSKYRGTREDYALCIPGFQFYKLSSGDLVKFSKPFGESLTSETVKDAFKMFLNGDEKLCRTLVLEILGRLWKILRWFRLQTKYKIYSSSVLIVYDAKQLRVKLRQESAVQRPTIGRQLSLRIPTGPLTPGFGDKSPSGSRNHSPTPTSPLHKTVDDWHTLFDNVCKTHSLEHDYEKDLQSMKQNYSFVLEDLINCDSSSKEVWVDVKMIDFAHVFTSNNEIDKNYLEGIENLVGIFEEFLFEANS